MSELEAALEKHFRKTRAGSTCTAAATHDEEDNISGIFQVAEEGSGTLIEGALARLSQQNVREPSEVFLARSLVAVDAQGGQSMGSSFSRWAQ